MGKSCVTSCTKRLNKKLDLSFNRLLKATENTHKWMKTWIHTEAWICSCHLGTSTFNFGVKLNLELYCNVVTGDQIYVLHLLLIFFSWFASLSVKNTLV